MKSFRSVNEEGNWQRLNKYGATWSFSRGLKTGPTALTRQTIERPLRKIGKLAKMLRQ